VHNTTKHLKRWPTKFSNATVICTVLHECAGAVCNTSTAFEKMVTTRKVFKMPPFYCTVSHECAGAVYNTATAFDESIE
jgi:hypothetical protein